MQRSTYTKWESALKFSGVLTSLLAAAAMNVQAAGLAGDSIDAAMIRTVDTGYGLGRIYGYGLDRPFVVLDGASDLQKYSGTFTLDVDSHGFSIKFLSSAGWQDGIVLRLANLDFGAPDIYALKGVSVETNLIGYSLSTGPDSLDILLGGTRFTESTYFNGTFSISSVPEPSALTLLAVALAPMLMVARSRVEKRS